MLLLVDLQIIKNARYMYENKKIKKPSAYIPSSMWEAKFHTHTKYQAELWLCTIKSFIFLDSKLRQNWFFCITYDCAQVNGYDIPFLLISVAKH